MVFITAIEMKQRPQFLFSVMSEFLATGIQQKKKNSIQIGIKEVKLTLFADDVIQILHHDWTVAAPIYITDSSAT